LIQKVDAVTVEEASAKAGGWGRFQTFLIILIVLSMWSGGLIEYNIAFLELDPTLNCYLKANPTLAMTCTREDVCVGDTVLSWSVDTSSNTSLNNWIVEVDLLCVPKKYIGFIGSFEFLGATIACFILPVAADYYGRLTVF